MDQPGIDEYLSPVPGWMVALPVVLFALGRLIRYGPRGLISRQRTRR